MIVTPIISDSVRSINELFLSEPILFVFKTIKFIPYCTFLELIKWSGEYRHILCHLIYVTQFVASQTEYIDFRGGLEATLNINFNRFKSVHIDFNLK